MFQKRLYIFSILLGVLAAGVLFGVYVDDLGIVSTQTNIASIGKEIRVDLNIDYGNGDVQSFSQEILISNQTVMDLLSAVERRHGIALQTRNFPGAGVFVEAIHGVRNTNTMYWQYWVNNTYAAVGADQYILQDADRVLWRRTDQRDIIIQ